MPARLFCYICCTVAVLIRFEILAGALGKGCSLLTLHHWSGSWSGPCFSLPGCCCLFWVCFYFLGGTQRRDWYIYIMYTLWFSLFFVYLQILCVCVCVVFFTTQTTGVVVFLLLFLPHRLDCVGFLSLSHPHCDTVLVFLCTCVLRWSPQKHRQKLNARSFGRLYPMLGHHHHQGFLIDMHALMVKVRKSLDSVVVVVVDHFYIALFSALKQTQCACMWFCMSE